MIITPASLSGLFTAYDTRFSAAYAKFETTPWYQSMCMDMPSKTSTNVYAWLARVPALREWVGPRVIQNLTTRSYTLDNKKYELTLGVKRDVIEDDQYDTYGPWIDMAGYEARKWPDKRVATVLQAGTAATEGLCFDGQFFFDTDHPVDLYDSSKGTQSNYSSSGKALTFDNYAFVRQTMMSYVGEDQLPLGIMPDTIFVPPQLEATAKIICETSTLAVSTQGGLTVVGGQDNVYKGTAKVVVIPELSNQPTAWYLADCSRPIKPLIWQLRQAPEFTFRNQLTDEHVFNSDEFLYGIRARGNAGFGLWFLMYKALA